MEPCARTSAVLADSALEREFWPSSINFSQWVACNSSTIIAIVAPWPQTPHAHMTSVAEAAGQVKMITRIKVDLSWIP